MKRIDAQRLRRNQRNTVEQARRQAQSKAPADYIVFRSKDMTDADVAVEVEAQRRAGKIGPHTRVTEYVWNGPPIAKRLV